MYQSLLRWCGGSVLAALTPFLLCAQMVTSTDNDGPGSLRQVIADASSGATIEFSDDTDGRTITLASEIVIDKSLTVLGNGQDATRISGGGTTRIFVVSATEEQVDFEQLSLADGLAGSGGAIMYRPNAVGKLMDVTIKDSEATGDAATMGGGAIANMGGTVYLLNATLSGNKASGNSGSGGAIINGEGGMLKVRTSSFRANTASRAGGALEDVSGDGTTVDITDTDFTMNKAGSAPGNGGAIHITGPGNMNITGGTARGNEATQEGGAYWNDSGKMIVRDVQFMRNKATGEKADDGGGALFNNGGTLEVYGGLFRGNESVSGSGSGGAIHNTVGGNLIIEGGTYENNRAARAGGAVESASGTGTTFTVTDAMMMRNGTGPMPGNGGAIHISGDGDATITGGRYFQNRAASEGGGLWNSLGTMALDDVLVLNNTARGNDATNGGGGIFNNGGTLTTVNTLIDFNRATGTSGSGGGIFNAENGKLILQSSEVKNSQASRAGGGIEDASGTEGSVTLDNVNLINNETGSAPGNGGGLHVTGPGTVTVTGGIIRDNTAASEGGGLWNGTGTMTVTGTRFMNNEAKGDDADNGGGAIFGLVGGTLVVGEGTRFNDNKASGTSGSGGAILVDSESTLSVTKATFTNNSASRAGGAIEDNSGSSTLTEIEDSDFIRNSTGDMPGNGGAIHITGDGDMNIFGGKFRRNTAVSEGGALWNGVGTMYITEASVTDNRVLGPFQINGGGGFFNNRGTLNVERVLVARNGALGGPGGGFMDVGGTMNILATTITGNGAASDGGGIWTSGTLKLESSTVVFNFAQFGGGVATTPNGAGTLSNNIVAKNRAVEVLDVLGNLTSGDYNLIGQNDGDLATADNDIVGTADMPIDPMIRSLEAAGGPTMTHVLSCGSPALDAGDPDNDELDQRGKAIVNGRRDIGAFERQFACPKTQANRPEASTIQVAANLNGATTLSVFPNPVTNGSVNVVVPEAYGSDVRMQLTDLTGRVLLTRTVNPGSQQISVSGRAAGTYLIRLQGEHESTTEKLIIRR